MSDEAPPRPTTSWSSTLSVAEMAAVHEAGLTPLGLVLGSSVYQVGTDYSPTEYYNYANGPTGFGGGWPGGGPLGGGGPFSGGSGGGGGGPWSGAPGRPGYNRGGYNRGGWNGGGWGSGGQFPGWTRYYNGGGSGGGWAGSPLGGMGGMGGYAVAVCWERTVLESGVEAAADLAMGRILHETDRLGGHGVIGTRLNFRWVEGLRSTIEFTAIGTAVGRRGAPPLDRPFTSHLDGQALLKLLRAGMVPIMVAVGAGAVTASLPSLGMMGTTEIAPFGDAIEASRRIAGERLQRNTGGTGWAILGTQASASMEGETGGRTMTTVLTGTAVRRFARGQWDRLPLPIMRLSKP
jgi:uncharacterized protein YbjQ (UPF0145 family)